HGSKVSDPGIAFRHAPGVAGEQFRKRGVEEAGVGRPASVVHQPGDSSDFQLTETSKARVVPAPARDLSIIWTNRLPQHRVTKSSDAEPRDQIQIVPTPEVPCFLDLITKGIADSNDRTFQASPKLQLGCPGSVQASA